MTQVYVNRSRGHGDMYTLRYAQNYIEITIPDTDPFGVYISHSQSPRRWVHRYERCDTATCNFAAGSFGGEK